ncbi:MAG: 23S rRNA (pseudouridine(1915)-N(3))-methyltransferase RlmH [Anaerovoracaceae bacterium]
MNINIICIGKLKEKYWQDAVNEYLKRMKGYCPTAIIELKEAKLPKNASRADELKVMETEGRQILTKVSDSDFVITLEIEGKMLDSVELSEQINRIFSGGTQTVDLIIGGSLGLSDEVKKRSNYALSFSRMTFPHQMMRVILLEQIYRAFKIINREAYHK